MASVEDNKYKFTYTGNPRNDAAILKTLKHGGPLVVAKGHLIDSMLPQVTEDEYADSVSTGRAYVQLTLMHTLAF